MARIIRARRATSAVRVGARRKTQWLGRVFSTDSITLGANTVILDSVLTTIEKALRPFTIVRSVGLLSVRSDQQAATESPFGGLGFAIVSDQAITVGVTAVPNPVSDVESDLWFLYQAFATGLSLITAAGFETRAFDHFPFDSRAMRKVEEGQDFAAVLANASATDGMDYILNYRLLVKLH